MLRSAHRTSCHSKPGWRSHWAHRRRLSEGTSRVSPTSACITASAEEVAPWISTKPASASQAKVASGGGRGRKARPASEQGSCSTPPAKAVLWHELQALSLLSLCSGGGDPCRTVRSSTSCRVQTATHVQEYEPPEAKAHRSSRGAHKPVTSTSTSAISDRKQPSAFTEPTCNTTP